MNPLIIGSNGSVAAIDPASGRVLWQVKLDTGAGFFSSTRNEDTSVLVKDGRVYAGGCGHLFCLDAATGQTLWHNPLSGIRHQGRAPRLSFPRRLARGTGVPPVGSTAWHQAPRLAVARASRPWVRCP